MRTNEESSEKAQKAERNWRYRKEDPESALVVLDFRNTFISAKKMNRYLKLDDLDDWLHWHCHVIEKIVFLDSSYSDGIRSRLTRSGWTIHDSTNDEIEEEGEQDCPMPCTVDIELALTIYDAYLQLNPGLVLLISGDGEFVPILKRICKDKCGIEVLSFKESLSRKLARFADRIHDISDIIDFSATHTNRLEKLVSYTFDPDGGSQCSTERRNHSSNDRLELCGAPSCSLNECGERR